LTCKPINLNGTALLDGIGVWIGFNVFVAVLLVLDLLILTRNDRPVSMRRAAWLTAFWWGIALLVGIWIFTAGTTEQGISYTAAFIVEKALSVDNLFVFLVIFGYFQLPAKLQLRALLFGIVGALIARALFITVGLTIIGLFSWILFILGAFLVYTAYKMAFMGDTEVDPGSNPVVRLFRKVMPVTDGYDGHKFFTRLPNGKRAATPFLMVIVALGTTDIIFAIDSIPTVFGITQDAFIVWSSNAMAVLGLRPLFFLLSGLVKLFRFLQYGLAIVLALIGVKMITEEAAHTFDFHLPEIMESPFTSLVVIAIIFALAILLSKMFPGDEALQHGAEPVADD
jgi:tellurite resistance protein TerC